MRDGRAIAGPTAEARSLPGQEGAAAKPGRLRRAAALLCTDLALLWLRAAAVLILLLPFLLLGLLLLR